MSMDLDSSPSSDDEMDYDAPPNDDEIVVYEEKLKKKPKTWMDSSQWGSKTREEVKQLNMLKPLDHKLFYPYRAIGHIIDGNAFHIYRREGKHVMKTFLLCSQGNTFLKYECDHLRVMQSCTPLPSQITAVTTNIGKRVYAAYGRNIAAYKSSRPFRTVSCSRDIRLLDSFGEYIIAIDEGNKVTVWELGLHFTVSEFSLPEDITPSCLVHPPTYADKIVIGTKEGLVQLWNLKSKELLYTFKQWKGKMISCMTESPALDVIAIGFTDGTIAVHNIKFDKSVVVFTQIEGAVTSLTFRTDDQAILASATVTGSIVLWDLKKKQLHNIISRAHESPVTCIKFLHGEPVLVSSGADNAIKMWIFDQLDGSGRILRQRTGHYEPPTKIKFFPHTPVIYSASADRTFRSTHLTLPMKSFELSQGAGLQRKAKKANVSATTLKYPPITDFDITATGHSWDDVISCHTGSATARTWKTSHGLGQHALKSRDPKRTPVKCVAISSCGNFTVLGSVTGWIDRYNIQSGEHRGTFSDAAVGSFAHSHSITFLSTDRLDGFIKIWEFSTQKLLQTIPIGVGITQACLHKENSLLGIATDDFVVRVCDLDTGRIIRKYEGHTSAVNDLQFTPDSRWLLSASSDSSLRVWDLPSAQLVDWYTFPKPATSMAFTQLGNFLVTTHVGELGFSVWVNNSYYNKVYIRPVRTAPEKLIAPSIEDENDFEDQEEKDKDTEELKKDLAEDGKTLDDAPMVVEKNEDRYVELTEENGVTYAPKPGLITLSGDPVSKWKALPDWDLIKLRNKPVSQDNEKPEAPFFLPTVPGLEPKFALPEKKSEKSNGRVKLDFTASSKWMTQLKEADQQGNYADALLQLKAMSMSAIEFELRALSLLDDYADLKAVMRLLINSLGEGTNFEIVESVLNLFLKIHGDIISQDDELRSLANQLKKEQKESWLRLQNMFHNSLCLIKFFSGIQMT